LRLTLEQRLVEREERGRRVRGHARGGGRRAQRVLGAVGLRGEEGDRVVGQGRCTLRDPVRQLLRVRDLELLGPRRQIVDVDVDVDGVLRRGSRRGGRDGGRGGDRRSRRDV